MLWCLLDVLILFFFFKQKTAYEMRISDWSSDVCSSDLQGLDLRAPGHAGAAPHRRFGVFDRRQRPPLRPSGLRGGTALTQLVQLHGLVRTVQGEGRNLDIEAPAVGAFHLVAPDHDAGRRASSEERRVGKECVSTCSSGWSPCH